MKKIYIFVIVYILILTVFVISLYNTSNSRTIGEVYGYLYQSLDYSIDIIKTNMNEITISNDDWNWSEIKEANFNDEQLKNTYNLLVSDIRTCYLLSNDLENKTYNNIKILSLRNKTNVLNKELSELNKNNNCLEKFNKYNSLVLSDNKDLSERIKKQIEIIIDYKLESPNFKEFGSLLYEESINLSKIASLTNWLKIEYYSRKKYGFE